MKKLLIITSLIFVANTVTLQAQNDEEAKPPSSQKFVSVEVMKPMFWFMRDLGYVIEAEFSYQHKALIYNINGGYSDIKDEIYDDLDYQNTGSYVKFGIGFQLNYSNKVIRSSSLIIGTNLIFTSFDESGIVLNDFSNYGVLGEAITQKNSPRGGEFYFTYRKVFDSNFFFSATPRIAVVLSRFNDEKFPVYYVPGFGVVNGSNDSDFSIGPTTTSNRGEAVAIGLSIKIGYRF
ncbi:MAG: DUF6048 family protein [Cyclobacteriaceae bacterium]|nr:DUF6048 family protein [Cyclobacteriaceae bacterium]